MKGNFELRGYLGGDYRGVVGGPMISKPSAAPSNQIFLMLQAARFLAALTDEK